MDQDSPKSFIRFIKLIAASRVRNSRLLHRVTFFARVPNLDPFTGEILDGYFDLNTKLNMLPAPKGR